MIELLSAEEQTTLTIKIKDRISVYSNATKAIYAIFEPVENEEIQQIFSQTAVNYTEPLALFDERLERVGARIVRLGENQTFDNWVMERALFYRWTCLFVTDAEINTFTNQISYLCNAITSEGKPVILRCYTPIILNDWLVALQQERLVHTALGLCSAILYIANYPNQLIHCHFQQGQEEESPYFIKIQEDLITDKRIASTEEVQFIQSDENKEERQWLISERQMSGLSQVRVNYRIHRLCQAWLPHLNIRNSNDWIEGHKRIERLVNLSFQSNVVTAHLIETFVNLYFEHHNSWKRCETKILEILAANRSEHDKLEDIANVLIAEER